VKKLSPVLQFLKGMKKGLTGSSVPERDEEGAHRFFSS
jgi:hypothetical protein